MKEADPIIDAADSCSISSPPQDRAEGDAPDDPEMHFITLGEES